MTNTARACHSPHMIHDIVRSEPLRFVYDQNAVHGTNLAEIQVHTGRNAGYIMML